MPYRISQNGLKGLSYSKFLMFRVFLLGFMTIAQIFEYEKGESAKSVPPPLVLRKQKNSSNTDKFFGCHNGIFQLKIRSFFGIL